VLGGLTSRHLYCDGHNMIHNSPITSVCELNMRQPGNAAGCMVRRWSGGEGRGGEGREGKGNVESLGVDSPRNGRAREVACRHHACLKNNQTPLTAMITISPGRPRRPWQFSLPIAPGERLLASSSSHRIALGVAYSTIDRPYPGTPARVDVRMQTQRPAMRPSWNSFDGLRFFTMIWDLGRAQIGRWRGTGGFDMNSIY
jgi:hypothetical protein